MKTFHNESGIHGSRGFPLRAFAAFAAEAKDFIFRYDEAVLQFTPSFRRANFPASEKVTRAQEKSSVRIIIKMKCHIFILMIQKCLLVQLKRKILTPPRQLEYILVKFIYSWLLLSFLLSLLLFRVFHIFHICLS